MIPSAPLNNEKVKISSTVRGFFAPSIPWESRNVSGDWSKYFGQWEGQKKGDVDTNCCWAFAGNEVLEDQLEFLWVTNRFSETDKKWFQDNGYIDSDGDFYLSRRYIPIISGVTTNGNDEAEFWRLTKINGAIPNAVLPFTNIPEYFDVNKITPAMVTLGKEFLKRVDVQYQELGTRFFRRDPDQIRLALFQSELQIGIPCPSIDKYNQVKLKWEGNTQAQHSVALYKYDDIADPEYPYFIYDQYNPILKQLSKDYYIPIITQAVINPMFPVGVNPVSQTTLGAKIWRAIWEFFNR